LYPLQTNRQQALLSAAAMRDGSHANTAGAGAGSTAPRAIDAPCENEASTTHAKSNDIRFIDVPHPQSLRTTRKSLECNARNRRNHPSARLECALSSAVKVGFSRESGSGRIPRAARLQRNFTMKIAAHAPARLRRRHEAPGARA
jgi:hypothetical protein